MSQSLTDVVATNAPRTTMAGGPVENGTTDAAGGSGAPAEPDVRWQYLRGEVDRQLSLFGHRRRRDKRKAFALQMATVTLSATVTVLLGLRTSDATRTWLLKSRWRSAR